MGPSEHGEEFVVEEPEPAVYNPTGSQPSVWQPAPRDILLMFQHLQSHQVLPLRWVCPGRRPPEKDTPQQPLDFMSDEDDDDDDKEEEKRLPEPSEFDFDDTASDISAKVKMTPRTPVSAQARRPEKKVARMDNVLNSIKRQQKAEREARKSQARHLSTAAFRGGGTPSRLAALSPASSPRLPSTTASPGPSSPRGSPRVLASPSSSRVQGSGDRAGAAEITTGRATVSPSADASGVAASTASASRMDTAETATVADGLVPGQGGVGGGGGEVKVEGGQELLAEPASSDRTEGEAGHTKSQ